MKERINELKKVKNTIEEYYSEAKCGLFDTRNIFNDPIVNIFKGKYFTLDICLKYSYFELFGTTDIEFNEVNKFYEELKGEEI